MLFNVLLAVVSGQHFISAPAVVHDKVAGGGYSSGSPLHAMQEELRAQGRLRELPPRFDEPVHAGLCSRDPQAPKVVPDFVACPAECPFAVPLPAKHCHKVCVTEGRCADFDPVLHFGHPETRECVPTCGADLDQRIPGCAKCAAPGICEECAGGWLFMPGYKLSADGRTCHNRFHTYLLVLYVVCGVLIAVILYYLTLLYLRPAYPSDALQTSLETRAFYKATQSSGQPYDLWSTSLLTEDVMGQGVMQYFSWTAWMMVISLALALCAYFSYQDTDFLENVEAAADHESCTALTQFVASVSHGLAAAQAPTPLPQHSLPDLPSDGASDQMASAYDDLDRRMFLFLVPTYLAVLVLTLALSWWQLWYTHKWESNHTGMRHFAARVEGLAPGDVQHAPLLEHLAHHSGLPREDFVGVSIAYDIYAIADELEGHLDDWGKEAPVPRDNLPWWKIPVLDSLFVDHGPQERTSPVAAVQQLRCSGYAVLVLRTRAARDALVHRVRLLPPVPGPNRSRAALTLSQMQDEPPAVLWRSFSQRSMFLEIVKGVGLFIAVIAGWAMLYLPYAMDYIYMSSVPGEQPSIGSDLLLGLLISLGNAVVGFIVEVVVGWVGFTDQGRRNSAILYIGFAAIFLNTIFDLLLVLEVAKGAHLDAAFEGHRVGYDAVLAEHLVSVIIPGYLVLPYLCQPVFLYALPYWVSHGVVRSRSVGHREGEKALMAPPFDVVPWRYADFVNNLTICLVMLFFCSPNSWVVMAALVGSFGLIFMIDKYLLLRGTSVQMYLSSYLSTSFARLLVLPTALLAGITAWWGWKAGVLPLYSPAVAAALHTVVYLTLLELFRPAEIILSSERAAHMLGQEHLAGGHLEATTTKTYFEVQHQLWSEGKCYSYWNTNPALCLRHMYLGEVIPGAPTELEPFSHGKRRRRSKDLSAPAPTSPGQRPPSGRGPLSPGQRPPSARLAYPGYTPGR